MNKIQFSGTKMKVVNLLRLARKANALAMGRTAVSKSVGKNKSFILFSGKQDDKLIANLTNDSNKKNIEISYLFDSEELSYILGRNKLTLVSVDDKNFAKGLKVDLEKLKD